jgi:hypothetical protein
MPIFRHPRNGSDLFFQWVASGLWIAFQGSQCLEWRQMQSIATISMTLKIERSERQRFTVFNLIGRIEAEHVAELIEIFDRDYQNIILDLEEVRLVDRGAVRFLSACEQYGMKLEHCPTYIREWMDREKD